MIRINPNYYRAGILVNSEPELIGYDIAVYLPDEMMVVSGCHIAVRGWRLNPLLMSVGTFPEYRRRGFGHELMRGVEQCLLENGFSHCYLETGRVGHARHLYECHGWRASEQVYIGNAPLTMEWRREWIVKEKIIETSERQLIAVE